MDSISGVQRRETASEGARLFITTELLTSRLRRELDKEKIIEMVQLINKNKKIGKIEDFLIATGVVHLFHYVGLRTQAEMSDTLLTFDAEKVYDKTQKEHLFNELKDIIQDLVVKEIEIYEKELNLEIQLVKNTIEKNASKDPFKNQTYEENNKKLMHKTLISLFRRYPAQYFYDFIGKIYDLADKKREEILIKASQLKATSLEIEQELKREYEDNEKFIELITFNYLKQEINAKWELKGHVKQLETQKVLLNKMESDILKKLIDELPFSKIGLKAKLAALELKLEIIEYIKSIYDIEKSLEEIEEEIGKKIKFSLLKQALDGPQFFLNFLSEYLNQPFDEILEFLKKYQVNSVPAFCQALTVPIEPIKNKLDQLYISDRELSQLSESGSLVRVKTFFESYKGTKNEESLISLTIERLVEEKNSNTDYILKLIFDEFKISRERLKELLEIDKKLKDEILLPFQIDGINQLRLTISLEEILKGLEKDLFYSIFKNFLHFFSRIIELYDKVKKDKEIILIAFKRISELKSSEKWIQVKLEDLIIEKIKRRQSEIQELLLKTDPLYINSFIFARLSNESIEKRKKDLNLTKSPIYQGILPISLKYENLPPISYATAYDLLMRIEMEYFEKKKEKEKKIAQKEETKKAEKTLQDVDTYSWIEKRISMAMMRIGKVDPTTLYWNENDSEKLSKMILLHTQVKEGNKICSTCGKYIDNSCEKHPNASTLSGTVIENVASFYKFSTQKFKDIEYSRTLEIVNEEALEILKKRGKTDVNALVEGEIQDLGKVMGEKLGKLMNKSLYKEYKKKKMGR